MDNTKLFSKLEEEFENNKTTIIELLKIDSKYCKIKVDFDDVKQILNNLKTIEIENLKEEVILIQYNGNPCITLNLGILALLTNKTLILHFNKNMLNINSFIVKTLNTYTEKSKVYIYDEKVKNFDKIICIDDINKYNSYLRQNYSNVKFYSLNYIDLYSDSDEFDELSDLIYQYAEGNQISIESYSELEADEASQMIKNGLGKMVVLLSQNSETKKKFEKNITNKKLYINKNPFEEKISIIKSELFI